MIGPWSIGIGFRSQRAVAQSNAGSLVDVMLPPQSDEDLCFSRSVKDFAVQKSRADQGEGLFKRFDIRSENDICVEEMHKMGINLRGPDQAVGTLSGGERQTVAIARVVYFGAKVLILDEPTSALGVRQSSNVLATVNRVRNQGIGVVFITHNVRHALAVGDRFTVLNRGKTLGIAKRGEISHEELQDLMAGGQELASLDESLGGNV